mgnify:CR=1 FL=1
MQRLKIRLESKNPDTEKVVGKATFKLDNEDKDIYRNEPLEVGIEHFKKKYMEPFSQLCCEIHCLMGVTTTGYVN